VTTGTVSAPATPAALTAPAGPAAPTAPADPPLDALPARNLDKRELRELVDRLAAAPELWREQVAFSGDQRHYASLHRSEHVDVWLLCWADGNDTGWHDHDVSSGAVRVVQGAITEHNLRLGGAHVESRMDDGTSFCFDPDHIHRLTPAVDGSVSIHAYSPPLWRMGQYSFSEGGVLRRVSVSYAEELRPIGPEPVAC
jgi:predicted metal-dependent enzyme (double-stranded beta helix superfamily)